MRSSNRIDDKNTVEDSFNDLSNDISGLHTKFNFLLEIIFDILNRMKELESRVLHLE